MYRFEGEIRDYNISKAEWALGGETVYYASADSIRAALDYDFGQEKSFIYKGLDTEQIVEHITKFVSGLWQIHAFGEGNTRATAVFAIKYLRTFGFAVANDLFSDHSWYFRNALVRANYNDYNNKIYATLDYLRHFFGNLLLGESNPLRNRDLHISLQNDADVPVKAEGVPVKAGNVPVKAEGVPVKRKDEIIKILCANQRLTAEELAVMFSVTSKTIKRDFAALKNDGKIKRVGSDKAGHWEV
jgi:hypothetical protein